MATSSITFFPVGSKNGGMTLIKLNNSKSTTILIDCAIGEDPVADYCDVNKELRSLLPKDYRGRPYVDAFILTHRHDDHLTGFSTHFHLGPLTDYKYDDETKKIVIRELWSSHTYIKNSSTNYPLCEEAKTFNKEMKRRVALFEETQEIQNEGDRCIIIGFDPDKKNKSLSSITYNIEDTFTKINAIDLSSKLKGLVLGPLPRFENEEDDLFIDIDRQSIVIRFTVIEEGYNNEILMAADPKCEVWQAFWKKYRNDKTKLSYDLLYVPHHCSWHCLSFDSQSECDNPQVDTDAKNALSQKKNGAVLVAQCKIITDKDFDPPSLAAKKEYLTIVSEDHFFCTNSYPSDTKPRPLSFNLTKGGIQERPNAEPAKNSNASWNATRIAQPHG